MPARLSSRRWYVLSRFGKQKRQDLSKLLARSVEISALLIQSILCCAEYFNGVFLWIARALFRAHLDRHSKYMFKAS